MRASEHILLESEVREVPASRTAGKTYASLRLRSRLRRRIFELDIIDYYYLAVRTRRPRSAASEYVIDLRFVDPSFRLSRHIPWWWMAATLLSAVVLALAVWRTFGSSPAPWRGDRALLLCGALLATTAGTALACAYRMTEAFTLVSLNGQVRLLHIVGGPGTFRLIRPFRAKLAAHVRLAEAARRPSRAEHLRDEMREHFRLKEAGALPNALYEAGKRRILSQHAPTA